MIEVDWKTGGEMFRKLTRNVYIIFGVLLAVGFVAAWIYSAPFAHLFLQTVGHPTLVPDLGLEKFIAMFAGGLLTFGVAWLASSIYGVTRYRGYRVRVYEGQITSDEDMYNLGRED